MFYTHFRLFNGACQGKPNSAQFNAEIPDAQNAILICILGENKCLRKFTHSVHRPLKIVSPSVLLVTH
jgi:hypothetical protein